MFGNIGKIMKLMGELKTKLPEMKQKLADSRFTAQAGGGAVKATVTGKLTVVGIEFDKSLLSDPNLTPEMLGDLATAAISAAQELAIAAATEAMKELTGGVEIPGMDLSSL